MKGLRLDALAPRGLAPLDLTVAPSELVLLTGPSGSGKSLLLRAVADLDPHDGEVWLDGVARSTLPAPAWRRLVGLLPAESHWWGDLVGEHFAPVDALGEGGGRVKPARASGLEAALLTRLGFTPEVLHWTVSRVSTGERQRLALARMLVQRPRALLLDEPTANLDPASRDRVEALIADYRAEHGAPVLWVSHDPEQRQRLGGRCFAIDGARLVPCV